MQFPVFLKYKNDKSYFRIDSPEELLELKLIGSYYQVHHLKAVILPDRVFISDLLNGLDTYCDPITQQQFDEKMAWCQQNLQALPTK